MKRSMMVFSVLAMLAVSARAQTGMLALNDIPGTTLVCVTNYGPQVVLLTARVSGLEGKSNEWDTAVVNLASLSGNVTSTNALFTAWLAGISGRTNLWNDAWAWGNHALAGYAGTQQVAAVAADVVALSNLVANLPEPVEADPHALLTNGTRAMASNLPMGGHSITGLLNIAMGGYWQALIEAGTSTIDPTSYGASQIGLNYGTQAIGEYAFGSSQIGYNFGTQSMGYEAIGSSQNGINFGAQSIGSARAANQVGYNNGTRTIADDADGANQIGRNFGTQTIGAAGASQFGQIEAGASATNNAVGAMQLLDLTEGQHALTTAGGAGSILLGAGTVSNRNAIVAGDGAASNGDGSITAAGGFFGSGANLSGLAKPADIAPLASTQALAAAIAPKLDRVNGTATNLSVVGTLTLNSAGLSQIISTSTNSTGAVTNMIIVTGGLTNSYFFSRASGAYGVRKTGQTTSYADGDDGFWEVGVAWPVPRFSIVGAEGTAETNQVRDNLTGLIWARDASLVITNWAAALEMATNQASVVYGYGGATDWRMPNIIEFLSLMCYGFEQPTICNAAGTAQHTVDGDPFFNLPGGSVNYWSSTTRAQNPAFALAPNTAAGIASATAKTTITVRCLYVRGGL